MKKENKAAQNGAAPEKEKLSSVSITLNRRFFRYALLLIAFTVLLVWGVNNPSKLIGFLGTVAALFSPFIVGFCIAFIVNTLMSPLERLWNRIFGKFSGKLHKRLCRPVCLAISFIVVFGVIFAVVFMLIPGLKESVAAFADKLPQYISNLQDWWDSAVDFLEDYNIVLPELKLDSGKILTFLKGLVSDYGESVINTTVGITASIVSVVINFVLSVVFSIYMLAQKETLCRQIRRVLYAVASKEKADKTIDFASLTNRTFSKFVTGQLAEAVIIGVLCFIGMLIFRMPYAGVISVLVGFTALIPVFGAFFGTAVGAFMILLDSPAKALWFVVFIIVLQQLEGNLIYPKVVGKSVGLPGIWVLAAVTLGGGIFGVAGMLFSVPVCSVLYCAFREWVARRIEKKQPAGDGTLAAEGNEEKPEAE